MLTNYLAGAALAVGLFISPASAAPTINPDPPPGVTPFASAVEKAHRRCWWHRGHLHCRRYVRAYPYYAAPYYSYDYGPRYYGYGPGIGLFFGGGHHHHHHGHHGHHHHH